ncbi:Hypothetical predicted protein [Xyrichtys novacula]|uniref:Uncharacterized protein n=1 Tax=Xyrichtys novacula TaxID=13765 RepID=A0AAV1GUP3_XYRNO|nr:Hypothetical predicted protein [Xyrichtys novacula]
MEEREAERVCLCETPVPINAVANDRFQHAVRVTEDLVTTTPALAIPDGATSRSSKRRDGGRGGVEGEGMKLKTMQGQWLVLKQNSAAESCL